MIKKLLIFAAIGFATLILLLGLGAFWLLGTRNGSIELCESYRHSLDTFSSSPEDLKILQMVAAPLPEVRKTSPDLQWIDFQYFQLPIPKGEFSRDADKHGLSIAYENNNKILVSRDGFSGGLAESSWTNRLFFKLSLDNLQTSLDVNTLVFSKDLTVCDPNDKGWYIVKKASWVFLKQMRGARTSIDGAFHDTKGEIFVKNQTINSKARPAYIMDVDFKLGTCGWKITYIFRNTDHRQAILEQIGHLKNRESLFATKETIPDSDFIPALKDCANKH